MNHAASALIRNAFAGMVADMAAVRRDLQRKCGGGRIEGKDGGGDDSGQTTTAKPTARYFEAKNSRAMLTS